jgi:putative DNA primase/helicase
LTLDHCIRVAVERISKSNGYQSKEVVVAGSWTYPNFKVIRFNIPTPQGEKQRKEFRPIYQDRLPSGVEVWYQGYPPGARSLYRSDELENVSTSLVTVHGGEKAADAARELGLLATTNAGGEMAVDKTDWSPVAKFGTVAIFLDNDQTGEAFANRVAAIARQLNADSIIKIVRLPGLPPKGDIVEAIAAGLTSDSALDAIRQSPDWNGIDPSNDSRNHEDSRSTKNLAESLAKYQEGVPSLDTDPGRTQLANAKRLVALHGDRMRWCGPFGSWLVYDGKRWEPDRRHLAERYAKDTANGLWEEITACAKEAEDSEDLAPLIRFARSSGDARAIDACLKLTRSEEGIAVVPDDLDSDPWLLNVVNGTIDLRIGELRPHRKDDLLTKLCPVAYDPEAKAPLWESVIARALNNTPDLIAFVKRLFGYGLTGIVREQILPVFYGTGANGKSVILGGFMEVVGPDYAMKAPQGMLCVKKGESHPTELADLFGRRFVAAIETNEGSRLDEALVKELTGNDRIRARFMRQDFFEFAPTHKVLMACNHKPVVRGTDHAIWRRLRVVPFTVTIPDEEQDKDLPFKLRQEAPGILAWAVRGCLEWQAAGLPAPAGIVLATERYRAEQDTVGEFLNSCCVIAEPAWAKSSDLLQAYQDFSGDRSMSAKKLGGILRERGFQDDRTTKARLWRGIGLLSDGWET